VLYDLLFGSKPNAGAHLLLEAGVRNEHRLEAVRCSAWLARAAVPKGVLSLWRLNERMDIPPSIGDFNECRTAKGHGLFIHGVPPKSLIELPRRIRGQHPQQQPPHSILQQALHKGDDQLPTDALPLVLR